MAKDFGVIIEPSELNNQPSSEVVFAGAGDRRMLLSTPERRGRAVDDRECYERRHVFKAPLAVETPGHLVALLLTAATVDDRVEIGLSSTEVQGERNRGQLGFVDRGFTGSRSATATRFTASTLANPAALQRAMGSGRWHAEARFRSAASAR